MAFKYLKFNELVIIDKYERQTHNLTILQNADLEGLAKSIAEIGIRDPFAVKYEDGEYILCDGYIRYDKIKEFLKEGNTHAIDINRIPCEVIEGDISPARLRIESNKKIELTPVQTAQYMRDCIIKYKIKVSEIAKFYGITPQSVRNHLEITRCIKPVQKAIESGVFPMSAGKQFCVLKNEGQRELFNLLMDKYENTKKIYRKLIINTKNELSDDLYIRPQKIRMRISQKLREAKKGSTLRQPWKRQRLENLISKSELETRTLERRLDRARDNLTKFIQRWEVAFRNEEIKKFVRNSYTDVFEGISYFIKDELGITIT